MKPVFCWNKNNYVHIKQPGLRRCCAVVQVNVEMNKLFHYLLLLLLFRNHMNPQLTLVSTPLSSESVQAEAEGKGVQNIIPPHSSLAKYIYTWIFLETESLWALKDSPPKRRERQTDRPQQMSPLERWHFYFFTPNNSPPLVALALFSRNNNTISPQRVVSFAFSPQRLVNYQSTLYTYICWLMLRVLSS